MTGLEWYGRPLVRGRPLPLPHQHRAAAYVSKKIAQPQGLARLRLGCGCATCIARRSAFESETIAAELDAQGIP